MMTEDFHILNSSEKAIMKCTSDKPCFCYGKLCLVPENRKDCNKGNVFIAGTPLCGVHYGWTKELLGKIVCQELGFRDAEKVTNAGE